MSLDLMARISIPRTLVLVFLLFCAGRAGAESTPQEQAEFLAGLRVSPGSPLAALQSHPAYENHGEQLAKKWSYCRDARWDAMRSWARKNLSHQSTRGVVRYLFGGPDFLGAHAFFPNAATLVLCGLEPVGSVTPPESLDPATLAASLGATRQAISTALFAGYFVTREMNAQLQQGHFRGVLPLLYIQMALTGNRIVSVEMVRPFGSPGLKISYKRGLRGTQDLYYFQANLADGPECNRFLSWLGSMGDGASYLKAASYLLHGAGFSRVRSFLLDTSTLLVEDDSGIPFRHFNRDLWKIKVFGEYTQPIFSGYYQNDFRDAYATHSNAGGLPFGAGYQVWSDKANILLATRNGRVPARARQAPAAELAAAVPPAAKAKQPPSIEAGAFAKTTPPVRQATPALVSSDAALPSAPAATQPSGGASLRALEAEELRIRQDSSITQAERMRRLHGIWQQQLAVMGKPAA